MIGCECDVCRSTDPRDKRLRPSILVETADGQAHPGRCRARPAGAGAGFQHHAAWTRSSSRTVTRITSSGIDEVRRFNALQKAPMPCYGDDADARTICARCSPTSSIRQRRRAAGSRSSSSFASLGPFCSAGQEVVPVPLFHGRRPILGFRFGRFAYLTDCSSNPGRVVAAARRARRAGARRAPRAAAPDALLASTEAIDAAARIGAGRPTSPTCATISGTRHLRAAAGRHGAGL